MADSAQITIAHIARIRELLAGFCEELARRGEVHDASKFDPIEKGPLDEMQALIESEGHVPYGSDAFDRRSALLGPMLEHHYALNSHHPEHYGADGVGGMDLFDLVEMFADWKAASERGQESTINLSYSIERYEIAPQLASILRNTAARLGWAVR
jgi:Family of unknown function (DUF5662)